MVKIVDITTMRRLEAAAFAQGVSEAELQDRAARAVARSVRGRVPAGAHVVVLVGPGNNGRDAYVAARYLAAAGVQCRLYLGPRHAITADELALLAALGHRALAHEGETSLARLQEWLEGAAVVVDGLLGIGSRGAPRPPLDAIIGLVNAVRARRRGLAVVAVDIPSGVDADSGAAAGEAVRADVTVSLGALKQGLLRFPAAELAGHLEYADIGLPLEALAALPLAVLDAEQAAADLPPRPPGGHKGSFGTVLCVAGSARYYGAAILCAGGAARVGAGLTALAALPSLQAVVAARLPEVIYVPLREGEPLAANPDLLRAAADAEALLVGPGLGRAPDMSAAVQALLHARAESGRPAVVDADGLNALAERERWWESLAPGNVLTPHPGEMARLARCPREEVLADPWSVARRAAATWRQIVVLKGAFTAVAEPGGQAWVYDRANPALASGGTGDVLAGAIAGLLAQGAPPLAAARAGVYLHARAAAMLVEERGWATLLASDLLEILPRALRELRSRPRPSTSG